MSRAGDLARSVRRAPKERLLADLEALVIRESPSDEPARVSQLALWVAERLSHAGLAAACVPCEGRGEAVRVRFGEETGGTLLLGHLDTVWPAGTLAEIPFSVEDGVAKGPGVFDMKAGIAVALAVLEAAAKGDVTPAGGVSLVLTPDEEVGSGASSGLLVEEALRRDRVLVLEPAGDGGAAKVARKGTGLVTVRFSGVASHAGLEPEKGASALLEMARFALYADALADKPAGTSVVPTVAGSGKVSNVVPERAELTVDFRVWTRPEADRLMAGLRAYRPADPRVTVEIDGGANRPPMESTEALARPLPARRLPRARARFRAAGGARRRRLGRQPHGGRRRPDAGRPRAGRRRRARAHRAPPRRRPSAPRRARRGPSRGRGVVSAAS